MDTLTITAASAMRSRLETLDLLSNNIANAGTAGYKSDRPSYQKYFDAETVAAADDGVAPLPTALPTVERHWTDFSQGTLTTTNNPSDLALVGGGFFGVQGPNGPVYTRNGSFHVTPKGELATPEGYAVRGADGKPLQLDPQQQFTVGKDGRVFQGGNQVGALEIVSVKSPDKMAKLNGPYFRVADKTNTTQPAGDVQVMQGQLESANGGAADSAVKLVDVLRQFEMLQRAATLGAEMNRRAVEEVAKVGA